MTEYLKEYNDPGTRLLAKAQRRAMEAVNPLVASIGFKTMSYLPAEETPEGIGAGFKGPTQAIEIQAAFPRTGLTRLGPDALDLWYEAVFAMADQAAEQISAAFAGTLLTASERGAIEVNAAGRPFSEDVLLDALEKFPIEFGEDGEPMMPTIFASPEMVERMRTIQPSPEFEAKKQALVERKRAEYHARKRVRRLD